MGNASISTQLSWVKLTWKQALLRAHKKMDPLFLPSTSKNRPLQLWPHCCHGVGGKEQIAQGVKDALSPLKPIRIKRPPTLRWSWPDPQSSLMGRGHRKDSAKLGRTFDGAASGRRPGALPSHGLCAPPQKPARLHLPCSPSVPFSATSNAALNRPGTAGLTLQLGSHLKQRQRPHPGSRCTLPDSPPPRFNSLPHSLGLSDAPLSTRPRHAGSPSSGANLRGPPHRL